ncbi:MAG: hypothetical protein H0V79_03930 [Actinobacteria bacterium]|nr:hypothetical protein [Actinomycetota bacterium]
MLLVDTNIWLAAGDHARKIPNNPADRVPLPRVEREEIRFLLLGSVVDVAVEVLHHPLGDERGTGTVRRPSPVWGAELKGQWD